MDLNRVFIAGLVSKCICVVLVDLKRGATKPKIHGIMVKKTLGYQDATFFIVVLANTNAETNSGDFC